MFVFESEREEKKKKERRKWISPVTDFIYQNILLYVYILVIFRLHANRLHILVRIIVAVT